MEIIEKAINAIESQQKGKEGTAPFTVGEQLKDICRGNAAAAEIVLQDLANEKMSIVECEKKIKEYADKQVKKNNCVCVPPNVAEDIIRKFYGITAESFSVERTEKPKNLFDLI